MCPAIIPEHVRCRAEERAVVLQWLFSVQWSDAGGELIGLERWAVTTIACTIPDQPLVNEQSDTCCFLRITRSFACPVSACIGFVDLMLLHAAADPRDKAQRSTSGYRQRKINYWLSLFFPRFMWLTYFCILCTLLLPRIVRNGFYSVSKSWCKVKPNNFSESQYNILRMIHWYLLILALFGYSSETLQVSEPASFHVMHFTLTVQLPAAGSCRPGGQHRCRGAGGLGSMGQWTAAGWDSNLPDRFLQGWYFCHLGIEEWNYKISPYWEICILPSLFLWYSSWANPQLASLFGYLMLFKTFWFHFESHGFTPAICNRKKNTFSV